MCRNVWVQYYGLLEFLSDGKKISGRERVTGKEVNIMENFYGIEIRQNSNDLFAMRKSVNTTLIQ